MSIKLHQPLHQSICLSEFVCIFTVDWFIRAEVRHISNQFLCCVCECVSVTPWEYVQFSKRKTKRGANYKHRSAKVVIRQSTTKKTNGLECEHTQKYSPENNWLIKMSVLLILKPFRFHSDCLLWWNKWIKSWNKVPLTCVWTHKHTHTLMLSLAHVAAHCTHSEYHFREIRIFGEIFSICVCVRFHRKSKTSSSDSCLRALVQFQVFLMIHLKDAILLAMIR